MTPLKNKLEVSSIQWSTISATARIFGRFRTHKLPPPVPILGQLYPVHIPTSHLLEIHPNIIHPSTPRSPQRSISLRFPHQDPVHPLSSPIRATCPTPKQDDFIEPCTVPSSEPYRFGRNPLSKTSVVDMPQSAVVSALIFFPDGPK